MSSGEEDYAAGMDRKVSTAILILFPQGEVVTLQIRSEPPAVLLFEPTEM